MKVAIGPNSVREELLRLPLSLSSASTLYYCRENQRIEELLSLAKGRGINCTAVEKDEISRRLRLCGASMEGARGVMLEMPEGKGNIVKLKSYLKALKCSYSTILALDHISDPQNLGAIMRSAHQLGANLIIIPTNRSVNFFAPAVAKSSAGASAWVTVAPVVNLAQALKELKEFDYWVYGADARGEPLPKVQFAPRSCIVLGSEGSGISKLVSRECDTLVGIPSTGRLDSLNVSVASGILLYERLRCAPTIAPLPD